MAYKLKTQISGIEPQLNACAGFTHYQQWGTLCGSEHHHPLGLHISQAHLVGLPAWMQKDCLLEDGDLVAWEVLGFHDASIAEDWPVILTNSDQLILKPRRFFNRSLAIGLAE